MIRIEVVPVETESTLRIEARVTQAGETFTMWWASNGFPLSTTGDPFVLAVLPSALEREVPIVCNAPVSAATRAWAGAWAGRHGIPESAVRIEAPEPDSGPKQDWPRGAGAFFTAGAISHCHVARHHSRLTHLVHVHGFSLPLHDIDARRSVSENLSAAAHRWELNLIELTTNIRTWSDARHGWFVGYREIALAAAEAALAPTLQWCVVPGQEWPTPMVGEADFADTVAQLSDVPAVATPGRISAVLEIGADRESLRSLWVCDDPRNHGSNCGKCLRCVETMVLLQAQGVLDRCPGFRARLDPHPLSRVSPTNPRTKQAFLRARDLLRVRDTDPILLAALESALAYPQRRPVLSLWPSRPMKRVAEA